MIPKLASLLPLIALTASCGVPSKEFVVGQRSTKTFVANNAWSAAKQRGIYYRGYGSQPYWLLEINERENSIVFKTTGEPDQTYTYVQPLADIEKGKTVFQLSDSKSIVIENTGCSDGTVGAQFETTVTLSLGPNLRIGCGRALY